MRDQLREAAESLTYWILAEYKRQLPRVAQDAPYTASEMTSSNPTKSVYRAITDRFDAQARRWQKKNDAAAERFGGRFAQRVQAEAKANLNAAFRSAGVPLEAKESRKSEALRWLQREQVNSALKAILGGFTAAVLADALASFIAQKNAEDVRRQISKRLKSAEKKAVNTARDLSDKCTQTLTRSYEADLGLNIGVWVHIPGRKNSRRTHEKLNGKEYDMREGIWDSEVKRMIQPGELPYCRCTHRVKVPEWLDKE